VQKHGRRVEAVPATFPSKEAEWALLTLLDQLWYTDDNAVLLEFETADEAVAAWHLRDEEGNFFKEHPLRHVLVLWEELFGNPAEEVIREQF
jgi:hypothetical protein